MYKYQDEKGKWHYTDREPLTEKPVEVKQLKVEPKRRVWLLEEDRESQPKYAIRNSYHGPIEVKLTFKKSRNVISNPKLPQRFVVQPGKSKPLIKLGAVNRYKHWSYELKYQYILGSPDAKHDSSVLYKPPIKGGNRFMIHQAFGGEFSHQDSQNLHAVDIAMPVGTPLFAARSGVVMDVENDFFKGGTDKKAYRSRANSIRILHDDGSMAVYAHLQLEKAHVYPGMEVNTGQLIGYSGNTGYSTGPHLHFVIQINSGMNLESIPFEFLTANGNAVKPEAGKWLIGF